MDSGRHIHALVHPGYLGVVMPCDDSHLVNNWEEEARRYAENAAHWRRHAEQAEALLFEAGSKLVEADARAEQAEAELERLRAGLREVYEISRLVGSLDVRLALRRLLEKPDA